MKLKDIIVEDAILPALVASERDAAITELLDSLVAAGVVEAGLRDTLLAAIIKREKRGSTGFGHGVAVPHVKHADLTRMAVAVGISAGGVEFAALDNQPVHSIFLLLSPEGNPEAHLDAMEAIFGNLSHETFRRFLRQARSMEDILTLLEEADERTTAR